MFFKNSELGKARSPIYVFLRGVGWRGSNWVRFINVGKTTCHPSGRVLILWVTNEHHSLNLENKPNPPTGKNLEKYDPKGNEN